MNVVYIGLHYVSIYHIDKLPDFYQVKPECTQLALSFSKLKGLRYALGVNQVEFINAGFNPSEPSYGGVNSNKLSAEFGMSYNFIYPKSKYLLNLKKTQLKKTIST